MAYQANSDITVTKTPTGPSPAPKLLWQLFLAFGRANIFGFGGGPSIIPLIRREVVDNFHWIDMEEFTDSVAMGNSLPGPIATQLAAYVGYKIAGILGALIALIATIAPTALAMLGLAGLYFKYKDTPRLMGMLTAVRPVIVVLLLETTWNMARKSFPGLATWVIGVISLILIFYFNLNPIILIVSAMLFGYISSVKA